jgi:hypothetical protein
MVAVCKDRRLEDCPPCLRISAFTQPWVDLRASAVSRIGKAISGRGLRGSGTLAGIVSRLRHGFSSRPF